MPKSMVADDEENVLGLLRQVLGDRFNVVIANEGRTALAVAIDGELGVVIADADTPNLDGSALIRELGRERGELEVVLMTAKQAGALSQSNESDEGNDEVEDAPEPRSSETRLRVADAPAWKLTYREALERARSKATREYLEDLLRHFDGNVTRAARRAAVKRESLHRLLKRYGISAAHFKASGQERDFDE